MSFRPRSISTFSGVATAVLLAGGLSFGQGNAMTLTSPDFADGQPIPASLTCESSGASPELDWTNAPATTRSFALVADDPDVPGGSFVHWVVYDMPASTTQLKQGAASAGLPVGAQQGKNGQGAVGWAPPCPPSGTHHYRFELYALDVTLPATASVNPATLVGAMQGHVLAKAELVGTYKKGG
jgi:Raf kinase inhibitor-like YbhB/YbcL family protein